MAWAEYTRFVRVTNADVSFYDYWKLYGEKKQGSLPIRTPKAMDLAFADPKTDLERDIWQAIVARNQAEAARLEQEIFKQRKRLADAERTLRTKTTKKALEDQRIATTKVAWALEKLADLRRTTPEPRDSRIYPGWHASVLVMENGRRVVKPMRYQCRPAGKPAFYDQKYPGTYNARRDNLEGFWRDLYGYSHGVAIFDAFFENVSRHRVEGRELAPGETEQNVILEFRPQPAQPMFVACLWSRWGEGEDELLSFAAITDEPPAEVAAAGHDRCVIPIKPEHLDAWLDPRADFPKLRAILDDRERPYYEHRKAA
jgi:putative SOS response-associated peptidase YedK